MGNDFMGQILGSVLGGGRLRHRPPNAGPGGLGDLLGGVLGGGGMQAPMGVPMGRGSTMGGRQGMLLALLLPLAMQWVQRNGGIGAVLERFRRQGYGHQADSWVAPGANQSLAPQQVREVVGADEIAQLSQQLGVSDQEVASGLSEILPEMVDQVTPDGTVPPDADEVLDRGRLTLEQALSQLRMQ